MYLLTCIKMMFSNNSSITTLVCVLTQVGTELIRGISGGQKKRTSIGMELIISPDIVFLDEPTTGLDATTAVSVIKLLKKWVHTVCYVCVLYRFWHASLQFILIIMLNSETVFLNQYMHMYVLLSTMLTLLNILLHLLMTIGWTPQLSKAQWFQTILNVFLKIIELDNWSPYIYIQSFVDRTYVHFYSISKNYEF